VVKQGELRGEKWAGKPFKVLRLPGTVCPFDQTRRGKERGSHLTLQCHDLTVKECVCVCVCDQCKVNLALFAPSARTQQEVLSQWQKSSRKFPRHTKMWTAAIWKKDILLSSSSSSTGVSSWFFLLLRGLFSYRVDPILLYHCTQMTLKKHDWSVDDLKWQQWIWLILSSLAPPTVGRCNTTVIKANV